MKVKNWKKATASVAIGVFLCSAALGQALDRASRKPAAPETDASPHITLGSNLLVDPCTGCSYSEAGGYFIVGPENCTSPGTTQWLAVAFIAATTGVPERISAPVILADPKDCPADKVTFSIYSDNCATGPGKPLVSARATAAEAPCDFAVANLKDAPMLIEGTKYWVVATTRQNESGLDANWYGSNNGQNANNTGAGWQQFPNGTPAFLVQGSGSTLSGPPSFSRTGVFGGNLVIDPCTGCNYDSRASGFDVRGPDNCTFPGMFSWEAVAFVAEKSGIPKRISASILLKIPSSCPENQVTLSLYTDNCGLGPGTALVSGVGTVPKKPCDLTVAKLRNAPQLTKGTKYWVVATTSDAQSGLDASWWFSNEAQSAISSGDIWARFNGGSPGFLVQ